MRCNYHSITYSFLGCLHDTRQSDRVGQRPHLFVWRFEIRSQSPHPSRAQLSLSGNPLGTGTEGEGSSLTQGSKLREWGHPGVFATPLQTSTHSVLQTPIHQISNIKYHPPSLQSKSCCFLVGRALSSFDLGNMDGAISGGTQEETIDDLLTKVR